MYWLGVGLLGAFAVMVIGTFVLICRGEDLVIFEGKGKGDAD